MKHVLFIHGAGEGAYQADAVLSESLQKKLGQDYHVHYPKMIDESNAPYDLWKQQIKDLLQEISAPVFLVGHSIGASHLTKISTEIKLPQSVSGLFLLAAPFWGGDGWHYEGYQALVLPKDSTQKLPPTLPIFLYHATDDEIVPVDHAELYAQLLPSAKLKILETGGHQCKDDLSVVAKDILTM